MYKYLHNANSRTVYKIPTTPHVIDEKDKRGRHTGWRASMEIIITKADNQFNGIRWQEPIKEYPRQHFNANYCKKDVTSYFLSHHEPDGDVISLQEYESLKEKYETIARSN